MTFKIGNLILEKETNDTDIFYIKNNIIMIEIYCINLYFAKSSLVWNIVFNHHISYIEKLYPYTKQLKARSFHEQNLEKLLTKLEKINAFC